MTPQVETVLSGNTPYVKATTLGGEVDWISFRTPHAAEQAAKAMQALADMDVEITLSVFFDIFMQYHAIPNLKGDSVRHYVTTFTSYIKEPLGAVVLKHLTVDEVTGLMRRMAEKGSSNRKVAGVVNVLSAILGKAVKWRYLSSNPVDNVDFITIGTRPA